ncbi:hypothetical protein [Streptomyces aurantiogriseus]|uniref:Uncharacterized protein n=1 Tax=Streptomyces aurantiogriseus TaxID=66870 RepID=A0A918FIB7_9ACTN|nr:hypothetical protein [Streptomyces aurantiogriseus]GGR39131.1 hypothetical protein GCM10010251_64780 [Streptomyces aurantiogriseus]
MGGADDPTIGEALIGLLLVGGAGVVLPALVVLPLIGLGIWLTHFWRRRRAKRCG